MPKSSLTEKRKTWTQTRAQTEIKLTRQIVRTYRDRIRADFGWSVADQAKYISYSRAHLQGVIGGSKPISPHFEMEFRKLMEAYAFWAKEQNDEPKSGIVTIVSKKPLPARLYILHPIVTCRVCGIHFEQINSRQRKCSPDCKPLTQRRRKSS